MSQPLVHFLLVLPGVLALLLGGLGVWAIRVDRRKPEPDLPRWAGPALLVLGAVLLLLYLPLFAIIFGAIPS